jgi:hypothetical protein
MSEPPPTLELEVAPLPDGDAEELNELTAQLRRDLLQLDVAAVERPTSDAPPGAKGIDFGTVGSLVVTLVEGGAALATVVALVQHWLGGRAERKIKLQVGEDAVEVTGVTSGEQERLLQAWLERNTPAP